MNMPAGNEIRKSVLKKTVLSLTILLFLFTSSNCIFSAFVSFSSNYTKRVEVNLDKSKNNENAELIEIDNISDVINGYSNGTVSFSSRIGSYIANGGNILPAQVELTDSSYIKFLDARITRGTYFSEDAYKNGRNVVVISERTAAKLFMSTDVVGNEVELLDEKYRIVGLYKGKASIISLMGSDGLDKVFVPFTSYAYAHTMPVDTIYINDKYLEKQRFRENAVSNYLKQRMYINTDLYKIMDFYNAPIMMSQMADILVFFIAVWCIYILAGFAAAYVRKNAAYIKNCMEDKYPAEFIKSEAAYICFFSAGILLFVSLAACIYLLARPVLYIPSRYIPQDNIFDLGFYADIIKSMIYTSNSSYGYMPTQLEKYYGNALQLNIILLVFVIPAFFSTVSGLKLLKLAGASGKIYAKAVIISCVSAAALSVIFSSAGGVLLAFPLKNLAFILLFCLLYVINRKHLESLLNHALYGRKKNNVKSNA